jgi:hypothetical protein
LKQALLHELQYANQGRWHRQEKETAEAVKLPDCHAALSAYQFSLRHVCVVSALRVARHTSDAILLHAQEFSKHMEVKGELQDIVQKCWFKFLQRWSTEARYSILESFLAPVPVHVKGSEKVKVEDFGSRLRESFGVHHGEEDSRNRLVISDVLYLSMPLLLGFLNLACRMMRLPVLPYDLRRMVLNGTLPYMGAWRNLPSDMKKSLRFTRTFFLPKMIPSTVDIVLQTNCLACVLHITLPHFNDMLIVNKLVHDLGLYAEVYDIYVCVVRPLLCRLDLDAFQIAGQSSRPKARPDAKCLSPSYLEFQEPIMAALLIAWKSTQNFGSLTHVCTRFQAPRPLIDADDPFFEMPETQRELDLLPRKYLDKYVAHLSKFQVDLRQTDTNEKRWNYYKAIADALSSIESRWKDDFTLNHQGPEVLAAQHDSS